MSAYHYDYVPKTFEDLACYWFIVHAQNHKAPSSIKRDQGILRNYLLPAFGDRLLGEIKSRDVEEFFSRINTSSRLGTKSCNDVLGLLKKIMNDAERWGFVDRSYANRVQKKKATQTDFDFWKLEEVRQYLGFWAVASQEIHPRILDVATVALYTGMRRGELAALRWDAVDFEAGFIHVRDSYCRVAKQMTGTTKSKKTRRVPICDALRALLMEIKKTTEKSDYVLPHFNLDLYHREFKRTAHAAGVREIRFHDLRHTFASHFLMGGGNIYDLQKILGHSSVKVTEMYTHLAPEFLKGKTEVLKF